MAPKVDPSAAAVPPRRKTPEEKAVDIKNSLRTTRGHLTRVAKTLRKTVDHLQTNPTIKLYEKTNSDLDKVENYREVCEQGFIELGKLLPDRQQHYGERLQELTDEADAIFHYAQDILAEARDRLGLSVAPPVAAPPAPPAPAVQAAGAAAQVPNHFKVQNALKPDRLNQDSTPIELKQWMNDFRVFYSASMLNLASIEEQHAFFYKGLDTTLKVLLQQKIQPNTPVFPVQGGIDSCYEYLEEHFRKNYPLVSRRLEFFRCTQNNAPFDTYLAKLQQKGAEADLAALTVDQLYVFKLMSGCSDVKLQERLFKIENPTIPLIQREAAAYELAKQCVKAVQRDSSKSQVVKVSKVQTQKNRGNSKTKNNPTKNASQKNKACFKCGGKLHENRDDCKANGKTCSECGKEGHFARARDGSALCFALRKKSSRQMGGSGMQRQTSGRGCM